MVTIKVRFVRYVWPIVTDIEFSAKHMWFVKIKLVHRYGVFVKYPVT